MKMKYIKASLLGVCLAVMPMNFAMASPASNFVLHVVDEQALIKQEEIDKYLFEEYKDEIAEKGITITHTAPKDGYVEVGITPYKQEHVDYLNEIIGTDKVQIVDADAPELYDGDDTMSITAVGEDTPEATNPDDVVITSEGEEKESKEETATVIKDDSKENESKSNTPIIIVGIVGVVIVLSGGVYFLSKKSK